MHVFCQTLRQVNKSMHHKKILLNCKVNFNKWSLERKILEILPPKFSFYINSSCKSRKQINCIGNVLLLIFKIRKREIALWFLSQMRECKISILKNLEMKPNCYHFLFPSLIFLLGFLQPPCH